MRTTLIIAGLLVSLAATPQEIYRWVDKDGVVHYADQPGAPNAERVTVSVPGGADEADAAPRLYQSEAEPQEEDTGPAYESISIASPAADEVFFGADATVNIQIETGGDLRPGDELLIFLDGSRVPNVSGAAATVSGLARGTHFLRAAIVDQAGKILVTSEQITFHVRQQSIANPPTGPSVPGLPRPPGPRPTPLPSRGG